jgi:hypothetical protein
LNQWQQQPDPTTSQFRAINVSNMRFLPSKHFMPTHLCTCGKGNRRAEKKRGKKRSETEMSTRLPAGLSKNGAEPLSPDLAGGEQ